MRERAAELGGECTVSRRPRAAPWSGSRPAAPEVATGHDRPIVVSGSWSPTTTRCTGAGWRSCSAAARRSRWSRRPSDGIEAVDRGHPAARRGGHGPAHARAERHRGDPADRAAEPARGGAGADHVRRRRLGVRGDARGPAATCSRAPTRPRSCGRCGAVAGGEAIFGPPSAARMIEYFAAPRRRAGIGLPRADRAGARGARPDRRRAEQRRDRRARWC